MYVLFSNFVYLTEVYITTNFIEEITEIKAENIKVTEVNILEIYKQRRIMFVGNLDISSRNHREMIHRTRVSHSKGSSARC